MEEYGRKAAVAQCWLQVGNARVGYVVRFGNEKNFEEEKARAAAAAW